MHYLSFADRLQTYFGACKINKNSIIFVGDKMENRYKKRQVKKSYGGIIIALLLVAVIALSAVLINGCKDQNGPDTPPVSTPSSSTESSSSTPSVPKISYEERVGKEYEIDIEPYLQYIEPTEKYEYVYLVNPTHTLSSDYEPADLIDCGHTRDDGRATQKMREAAAKSLQAFLSEGAKNGVRDVTVTSAYRSYSYQNYLFNLYCEQHQHKFATREECEKYVLTFSTKPGTSEHQSGLCCDMHNIPAADVSFAEKAEAKWLAENCYRFGFILRYPAGKKDVTGIIYEPWHFRFVGREAATEMNELGLCLEEYIELKKDEIAKVTPNK